MTAKMLSAVVLTKNEESNLEKCLISLAWCNEIIIIDDYSSDRTRIIAKNFKARIYKRKLNNNFSSQRNFGLNQTMFEWVLFVDADEAVSSDLVNEIKSTINDASMQGAFIRRTDIFLGKKMNFGENNSYFLRLGKKNKGRWKRSVHEYWDIKGKVKYLSSPIYHYSHGSVSEFVSKLDFYSTLHSRELENEGKKTGLLKILIYPKLKFILNYIFKLGFLDSTHGFVMAVFMSFHSFLSWSKYWLEKNKSPIEIS